MLFRHGGDQRCAGRPVAVNGLDMLMVERLGLGTMNVCGGLTVLGAACSRLGTGCFSNSRDSNDRC